MSFFVIGTLTSQEASVLSLMSYNYGPIPSTIMEPFALFLLGPELIRIIERGF